MADAGRDTATKPTAATRAMVASKQVLASGKHRWYMGGTSASETRRDWAQADVKPVHTVTWLVRAMTERRSKAVGSS